MKKDISILVILIALVVVGLFIYRNDVNSLPFIIGEVKEVGGVRDEHISTSTEEVIANCYVGGCSGQICSDEEGIVSTCEFRQEYACYQNAKCERQSSGQCGWTVTPELSMCLNEAQ